MSQTASNEELEMLERGALATLAAEAKGGDAVAARALLQRVDKIRSSNSGRPKIMPIDDPDTAAAIIDQHSPARVIADVGPAPPMPTADMPRIAYLEAEFLVIQHGLKIAQANRSSRDITDGRKSLRKVHAELARLRKPGSGSVWEAGSSAEIRKRFDAAMSTAPTELLEAAAAELRRRRKK